jgi:hypothetical protein
MIDDEDTGWLTHPFAGTLRLEVMQRLLQYPFRCFFYSFSQEIDVV